jgi:hypothetical protein
LPTTELRGLVVVGHGMLEHLVLRVVLLLLLVMVLLRLMMGPDMMLLVEGSEAVSGTVLDVLYMGNKNALFRVRFWMCSIVDIRILPLLVAGTKARHAWVFPQRPALADRWVNYVLDHCWCRRVFLEALWLLRRLFVFRCVDTFGVSKAVYIMCYIG